MKFIDLFAGLGGFHVALGKLGHTCVFASEIDDTLRNLYAENFRMPVAGDICGVKPEDIPEHDILCAGFPCQPFSKARKRDNPNHSELSELYKEIIRIIHDHEPRYFILENVPDLLRHDNGNTWKSIKGQLEGLDAEYDVDVRVISPYEFGIPQIRKRAYIVGSRTSLDGFEWPVSNEDNQTPDLKKLLDSNPEDAKPISDSVKNCLKIWQEFLEKLPPDEKIPLPLWSMEFGATYPYEKSTPYSTPIDVLKRKYHGSYGQDLSKANNEKEVFALLPSHARTAQDEFPQWKVKMIRKNRQFYKKHKDWLDGWMQKIREYPSSFQKLEWNCQ